jgi:hypothetical protein
MMSKSYPFVWRNINYLYKMRFDWNFLTKSKLFAKLKAKNLMDLIFFLPRHRDRSRDSPTPRFVAKLASGGRRGKLISRL